MDSTSILDLAPPKADLRVQYGSDPLQFVDLFIPTAPKPWPVLMNIHGGFWRAAYDLAHAGHFCAALANAGFATYNIEYRRVGNKGGGWPGTLDDLREAYKFICDDASGRGGDPQRLVVIGHSAGGQLAIALAAYESSVRRVVSLAGVLDLHRAYELHLSNDAVAEFLGGTLEQAPACYRAASPSDLSVKAQQVVVTGAADDTVPPEISREYVAKKRSTGELVELVEIPGAGHMDVIDPRSRAFRIIAQETRDLLA